MGISLTHVNITWFKMNALNVQYEDNTHHCSCALDRYLTPNIPIPKIYVNYWGLPPCTLDYMGERICCYSYSYRFFLNSYEFCQSSWVDIKNFTIWFSIFIWSWMMKDSDSKKEASIRTRNPRGPKTSNHLVTWENIKSLKTSAQKLLAQMCLECTPENLVTVLFAKLTPNSTTLMTMIVLFFCCIPVGGATVQKTVSLWLLVLIIIFGSAYWKLLFLPKFVSIKLFLIIGLLLIICYCYIIRDAMNLIICVVWI